MRAICIATGQAWVVGADKPRFVELGEIHDVVLLENDRLPANFAPCVEEGESIEPPEKKKGGHKKKETAPAPTSQTDAPPPGPTGDQDVPPPGPTDEERL